MGAPVYRLNVKEVDGAPSVSNVRTIRITNGTLTDDGSGQITITFPTTSVGGSSGEVQFNNAGSFDGAAGLVVNETGNGYVAARQIGGSAGTDEVRISHDGSQGLIECRDGYLELHSGDQIAGRSFRITQRGGGAPAIDAIGVNRLTVDGVLGAPGSSSGWSVDGTGRLSTNNVEGFSIVYGGATLSTMASNQNEYNIFHRAIVRLSASTPVNITGFTTGAAGQQFWGFNVGTETITLKHQDGASGDAFRIISVTGADLAIAANEGFAGIYDGTSERWRVWKL